MTAKKLLPKKQEPTFRLLAWPILFLLLPISSTAFAHVKWFVTDEGTYKNISFHADYISMLLVAGFLLFLMLCGLASRKASTNKLTHSLLHSPLGKNRHFIWMALKFSVAILLTANLLQNNFIAPNFVASPSQAQMLMQATLIVALIVNVNFFAILLAVFAPLSLIIYPFASAIDYAIELFALAIAIYFCYPERLTKRYRWSFKYTFTTDGLHLGLSTLRVGLGLQLIVLTLHDKFFHPGLAMEFLSMHPEFNFVHLMGVEHFSNLHFVLAAGLAELAFGLILVTNIATRIGLGLILFFFTLTSFLLGVEELIGHVPIVVSAALLFAYPTSLFTLAPEEALEPTWTLGETQGEAGDL